MLKRKKESKEDSISNTSYEDTSVEDSEEEEEEEVLDEFNSIECKNCKKRINKNHKFCGGCGSKVILKNPIAAEENQAHRDPKRELELQISKLEENKNQKKGKLIQLENR